MTQYVSNPDMVARRIRGESILVPIARTMDGLDSIISLNETAEFIRAKAEEGLDDAAIAHDLSQAYDIDPVEAAGDVALVIAELLSIKAITKVESA